LGVALKVATSLQIDQKPAFRWCEGDLLPGMRSRVPIVVSAILRNADKN
jgi:hypothetical protein